MILLILPGNYDSWKLQVRCVEAPGEILGPPQRAVRAIRTLIRAKSSRIEAKSNQNQIKIKSNQNPRKSYKETQEILGNPREILGKSQKAQKSQGQPRSLRSLGVGGALLEYGDTFPYGPRESPRNYGSPSLGTRNYEGSPKLRSPIVKNYQDSRIPCQDSYDQDFAIIYEDFDSILIRFDYIH